MPYTHGLPFASQSETSREAAVRASKWVGKQGELVYAWLAGQTDGGTQKECSAALGLVRHAVAPRFHALEQAGRIQKTPQRRGGCQCYEVVR